MQSEDRIGEAAPDEPAEASLTQEFRLTHVI